MYTCSPACPRLTRPVASPHALDPRFFIATKAHEGHVFRPSLPEPRLAPIGVSDQKVILERYPRRGEVCVPLVGAHVGPTQSEATLLQKDLLGDASAIALVPTVKRIGIQPRVFVVMAEAGDLFVAGQPVGHERPRRLQLQSSGADALEFVGKVTGPRDELLKDFAPPVESVGVVRRPRVPVDEPVRREAGPLAVPRILICLVFDPEERNA